MKKMVIFLIAAIALLFAAYFLFRLVAVRTAFSDGVLTGKEAAFGNAEHVLLTTNDIFQLVYPGKVFISLKEIQDTRCPKNVECIQAGSLSATFNLSGGLIQHSQDLTLTLGSNEDMNARTTTTVDGYTITLQGVETRNPPYGYEASSYDRATIVVELAREKVDQALGNALEKKNLIYVTSVSAHEVIKSPLTIDGEARGNWYFEASFPVELLGADNEVIARGVAQAQSDWMTEDFVPFTTTLTFTPHVYKTPGTLVLHKENPSGDPSRDDALFIPVQF